MKGFIVDATYDVIEDKTTVQLTGRLENNQSFVSYHTLKPYLFIKSKDKKKAGKLLSKFDIEETKDLTFKDEPVIKIAHNIHTEVGKLASALHKLEIDTYEADVKPHTRFLIDNDIKTSLDLDGEYQTSQIVNRFYINPKVKSASFIPQLKILSLDTESDEMGNLFCIGLYTNKYKKCFVVTKKKLENTISCSDEADCLEKVKQEIIKLDPDLITGWNFIDFDLVYLQGLYRKHKIPFSIGRLSGNVRLRIESEFFKSSTAEIPGRMVLDGLNLIRDPFIKEAPTIKKAKFESYTLENVSRQLLGKGKLLSGKDRHKQITEYYHTNQQKLVDYNLMDCQLVYEILEKTNIIDLAVERCQLTGLTLDRLTASIAAFDSLYIREARKRHLVSPTTRFSEREKQIIGGYVYAASPGIYNNVLVFDFKSLYPSLMRTFNIDPASYIEEGSPKDIESPNNAHFKNQSGILPHILTELHNAREKAKAEKREFSNYAIKIIMNSFFGVLASPNCRYYNYTLANSITHFAQHIIKLTAEKIKEMKHTIIYSDTDSVFVEVKDADADKMEKQIPQDINNFYKELVEEKYHRKSFLELQFAKHYISMMLPAVRKKDDEEETKSAKKRYAGLLKVGNKEEVEAVGLEAIRGDWTEAAQDFQLQLLMKVFKHEPIDKFIKDYIKKLESGKLDDKLVYRKSIRKDLTEYTKTTPPHVKAARKLPKLEGNIIEYLVTEDGPEPIQLIKHKIDYKHYIKKQIEPIANQVLSLFNKTMDEILKSTKQTTLF